MQAYEELMIKIAMSSYAEIDGQEAIAENDHLKKIPQFQITSEVKKNIHRTVQKEALKKSIYRLGKGFYVVAGKVAMAFFVAFVLFSTTMLASAEFRGAIYRLVFTYEKEYTLIELDRRSDMEFVDGDVYTWNHAFAPTEMPHGYQISQVVNMADLNYVIYENESDGYIVFYQNRNDSTLQVDTENAQLVQTVLINDSEGLLVNKDGINTLVWRIGDTLLHLEANEDSASLMAIAKGIRLMR